MPAMQAPRMAMPVAQPQMPSAPMMAEAVEQPDEEWTSPATEEIPTKPPVASKSGIKMGGPKISKPIIAEPEDKDGGSGGGAVAAPSKVDMILAIVAALMTIGVVVVMWLKVISKLDPAG